MGDDAGLLPWKPRSPQSAGMQSEVIELRKRGARSHPRSGAGSIKGDGSTEDAVYEMKMANRSFTVKAADWLVFWQQAARLGKEARFVITFANGVVMEGTINKEV